MFAQPKSYRSFIGETSSSLIKKGKDYIFEKDMPDSALACFSVVVNRFDPLMDREEKIKVVEAYNRLWYLYFFVYFDYVEASNCLKMAADISDRGGLGRERIDLNYGCMYQLINEQSPDSTFSSLASEYLVKAFHEADSACNEDVRQYAMANLLSLQIGDTDAVDLPVEWTSFSDNTGDKDSEIYRFNTVLYTVLNDIGKGDYDEAVSLIDSSLALLDFKGDGIRCKNLLLLLKARIFYLTLRYDKAMDTMKELEELANKNGLTDSRMETYRIMSEYLEKMGEDSLAYDYKIKNLMLRDSILNSRQLSNISELHFLGEIKDMKVELTKVRYREKTVTYGFIVAVAVVAMVALFLWILWNKNKRLNESNRALYEKNEDLIRKALSVKRGNECEENVNVKVKYSGSNMDDRDKELIFEKVKEVLGTSDEIYSDEFCIGRLALLVGVKEKILSQVINEVGGCNFTSFINYFRIIEACQRITDKENFGNITIESIGNSVGFKSRSAFIAAFKRQTGLTPSEYKRQAESDR